jgi:hypothetical protein
VTEEDKVQRKNDLRDNATSRAWRKSRELPDCGAHCEHIHGDQADLEQVEIDNLRNEVVRLKKELSDAHGAVERVTQMMEAEAEQFRACLVEREWLEQMGNELCGLAFDIARANLGHEGFSMCAYCGQERIPRGADMQAHAESCAQHPMARLKAENACLWASRVHWIFSVREAIRRGDVDAVKKNAQNNETFVENMQADQIRAETELAETKRTINHFLESDSAEAIHVLWVQRLRSAADGNTTSQLRAERDGAIAQAAAAKREVSIQRSQIDCLERVLRQDEVEAVTKEREACAKVAELPDHASTVIARRIRARGDR